MAKVKLTNPADVVRSDDGLLSQEAIRTAEVPALVDTGATQLVIPDEIRGQLGLTIGGYRRVRNANGQVGKLPWVGVLLEVLGRSTLCDALVEASGTQVLLGQTPLETLDLIVNPKSRDLLVNPQSPDLPLLEILASV